MKKVLYGMLFFLIGIGYFLLSWASWLVAGIIIFFILVLDIFLIHLGYMLYRKMRTRFAENYQQKMIFIFVLLMPLVLNLAINCWIVSSCIYDGWSNQDSMIQPFAVAGICFKELIFSIALFVYSIIKEKKAKQELSNYIKEKIYTK